MTSRWIPPIQWSNHFVGPQNLPEQLGHLPLPLFQAAVTEFHMATRWPIDLGYFSALSALSVALQNQVDMVTPLGRRPSSLYMLGIGSTSAGKSLFSEYFLKPIEDFEMSRDDILQGRPFIFNKGSPAALHQMLQRMSTCFLLSYEGRQVLESVLNEDSNELNNAWSGEPIRRNYISHGNVALRNARLSMLALLHPGTLDKVMRRHGQTLRDSGFLARLLVVATPHNPSTDHVRGVQFELPAKQRFHARLIKLLEDGIRAAVTVGFQRSAPELSEEAEEIRVVYARSRIEMTREQGYFESEAEHALKLAEIACRIAVLLHAFEGFDGPVSASTLWSAIVLAELFSQHYMANLGSTGSLVMKLNLLNDWINRKLRCAEPKPILRFPKSLIGQMGPNRLRDPEVYEPLLDQLEASGVLRVVRSMVYLAQHHPASRQV